jgi:hypothetical protein
MRQSSGHTGRRERVSQKLERINRETVWDVLSRAEFSDVMIGMEDATTAFYESGGAYTEEDAAIQAFWAREWGCTYDWQKREWRHTSNWKRFESEGEKRAKAQWAERKAEEEREALAQAEAEAEAKVDSERQAAATRDAEQKATNAANANSCSGSGSGYVHGMEWVSDYDDSYAWNNEYECVITDKGWSWTDGVGGGRWDESEDAEADADAYAHAAATTATAAAPVAAPVTVSAKISNTNSEPEAAEDEKEQYPLPFIPCQGVLYLEEHAETASGAVGTDWRIFVYYDEDLRRYVVKCSRRTPSSNPKPKKSKTIYPDVQLTFRRKREVLDYLHWCMNVRPTCDVVMYAMNRETVRDPAFSVDRLCRMKPYGQKTELYGYDGLSVRSRDLADQLDILRSIDWTTSTFRGT